MREGIGSYGVYVKPNSVTANTRTHKLKMTTNLFKDKVHQDGCYCFVSGPAYESMAESRFLLFVGGDSVGMVRNSILFCSDFTALTTSSSMSICQINFFCVSFHFKSTVPEVIAAKHCEMRILGLSLITNKVITERAHKGDQTNHASHAEVLQNVELSG